MSSIYQAFELLRTKIPAGNNLRRLIWSRDFSTSSYLVRKCSTMAGSSEGLRIYNSLTRTKDVFKPNDNKEVKFYICGPTVYDSSHMGHARAYLSFDILRRVMENYFNYNVNYVMNVTDIDDKIIKRARQCFLFERYLKEDKNANDFIKDVTEALVLFSEKADKEGDKDKKKMLTEMITRVNETVKKLESEVVKAKGESNRDQFSELLISARDILSDWLDTKFGGTVNEFSVFSKLARKFEKEFWDDMNNLGVKEPSAVTRVSEFIPEIIEYVQKIVDNGYGYVAKDGSVYFDTLAFSEAPNHNYAKLVPEAFGDTENLQKHLREGEGELSLSADKVSEKRNLSDFALWKSSKEGEPFWDSPWGQGRPGWHIECSAMSTAICGEKLDIHAGGFDLKFPHHDNEIAQCEAYFNSDNWVNYFLHCGTLRIQGSKMSKSLKNFITIKKALESYTARQLRILFLMHNWTDVLDYSNATMEHALQFEKMTNEFFLNVKDHLRRSSYNSDEYFSKFGKEELEMKKQIDEAKEAIHLAFCDSVDTRSVIEKIRQVISYCNLYIKHKESSQQQVYVKLLRDTSVYITWLLKVFGVVAESEEIGLGSDSTSDSKGFEERLMPYLDVFVEFREKVREIARKDKIVEILKECDRLRDESLPEVGVRLEDKANQTCVKLVDRETLLREIVQQKALQKAKEEEKERKRLEKEAKERAKAEAAKINPAELFKQGEYKGKFKEYDENGMPTIDSEGNEISKKQLKKLQKMYDDQKKAFEAATQQTV
ncbi:unnamed protein product [Bursaphelenchus okinawaensis]|uniref:Cysteine--tRNA ligase, cytoplasmic n=1 Tax=Bursaphelenchus okinawaensis TaxID=465554 RepID=A0A811KV98_9BILA|nr:unnamed protein product [Bursaphelenchus okinawaensis]CAG9112466.1 unnamed protein product [Bursaphelenchus okinawaensis]